MVAEIKPQNSRHNSAEAELSSKTMQTHPPSIGHISSQPPRQQQRNFPGITTVLRTEAQSSKAAATHDMSTQSAEAEASDRSSSQEETSPMSTAMFTITEALDKLLERHQMSEKLTVLVVLPWRNLIRFANKAGGVVVSR